MHNFTQVQEKLSSAWQGQPESRLNTKKVNVSNYSELKNEIPVAIDELELPLHGILAVRSDRKETS